MPSPGKPGRPRALTPGEERLFCGWVLAKNERNEIVDLEAACDFLRDTLLVPVARMTAHNILHRLGFTSKLVRTRREGYRLDKATMLKMATDWLNARTDEGFFNVHPSQLGSIDFTFTSHRTARPRSYSQRGG